MKHYKCAFSGALMGKQFGCQSTLEVTRRDGPSMACTDELMHSKCALLMERMREVAIPQFGFADDLSQMPHSVVMKIQQGGLSGLQKLIRDTNNIESVSNIQPLVIEAEQRYGDFATIPINDFVDDMINYKLRRR